MCHVSHLYETGASLYFTFIARQRDGAEIEQWRAAKTAACEAIVAAGGTITHHHAVGRDHAPWLHHETSDTGLAALRAVKDAARPRRHHEPGEAAGVAATAASESPGRTTGPGSRRIALGLSGDDELASSLAKSDRAPGRSPAGGRSCV